MTASVAGRRRPLPIRLALLLAALSCSAQASPPSTLSAGEAVQLFQDHCIANRSSQTRFAESIGAIATLLDDDATDPYAMGEMGHAWQLRSQPVVFFLTRLGRCRMFILSDGIADVPTAFQRMASNPPDGISSRAFQPDDVAPRTDFIWTTAGAAPHQHPMRIAVRPGTGAGLDPAAAGWIFTAEAHLPAPAPMEWPFE